MRSKARAREPQNDAMVALAEGVEKTRSPKPAVKQRRSRWLQNRATSVRRALSQATIEPGDPKLQKRVRDLR